MDFTNAPVASLDDAALSQLLAARLLTGDVPAASEGFARSLLAGFKKYRTFTPKQRPYVERIVEGKKAPAQATAVGSLDRITSLFEAALKSGLTRPRLTFQRDSARFTVNPAKPTGVNPGALYVKADGQYLGKVLGGSFMPVRDVSGPVKAAAETLLREIAADPIGAARSNGHVSGMCCFCARTLTDARSVAEGYGPVCAERFGLSWGDRKADLSLGQVIEAEAAAA